ncbi:MAG: mechanosensitive ion channel family protein [Salibacteraceae bacterium]
MDFQSYIDQGTDYVINYAPKFLIALVILWVGLKIIKAISKSTDKMMASRGMDDTLRPFIQNLISWTLKFALFILVADQVGIDTMSFMAIFGAAGLAIGLALQGTLSNFASGVMLLIFRPFKVGDFVDVAGHMGTAEEIGIFVTALRSPENRLIIIPNSAVGSGSLTNYSNADKVQVRIAVGIAYDADIKQAREVILAGIKQDTRVMQNEAIEVLVAELGDSSINLSVRFWCNPGEYWPVFFDNLENVKTNLDAAKIEIPFPQRVVHMQQA